MKKFSFYIVLLSVANIAIFTGCEKALNIEPRQSVSSEVALQSREGVNAAVTGVYSRLKSARLYGRDLIALPEALSDNGWATNKSGRLLPEARNNFNAHFTGNLWSNSYRAINDINLVLEALPKLNITPALTTAETNQIQGQMYFLRGLFHFNVVLAYAYIPGAVVASQDRGGIPILITATRDLGQATELLPSRAPINDVYVQIVKDLEEANRLLVFTGTNFPNLANKAAAQGLLSRVNLYRKDFAQAKRWADSCINIAGTRITTSGNYVAGWRGATHPETLFQVQFANNSENIGVNESLQTSFTTLVTPGGTVTGGFGDLVPTLTLLNDLGITLTGGNTLVNYSTANAAISGRSADVRNLLYEAGTTGRGKSYVETTKYVGKNGFINLDNIPVIRIAEVYLNRAEALATPGSTVFNESSALVDLNTVATNRGLPAFSLSGVSLYDEILRQRRIELAFEGHRFWDLKRLGRDLIKGPHYNDVGFTDIRILAPIPQREIDGNPNLKQNAGY
ncbi:MAG TPA: RagB/SusD family nutrient uptake outer membrane protein [Flavitalea sp.]|nr:RagB/SusD family nutrient uptake outer membrane protein [Flavitalea sp.]